MSGPRTKLCRGCERQIPYEAAECGLCGWEDPAMEGVVRQREAEEWQCRFELDGQRCPMPGSISTTLNGSLRGYCRFHIQDRHRDAAAREQLEDMVAHPERYMPPAPWQDVMLAEITQHRAERDARRDEESRSEYASRMQQERRRLEREAIQSMSAGPGAEGDRAPPSADPSGASARPAPKRSAAR